MEAIKTVTDEVASALGVPREYAAEVRRRWQTGNLVEHCAICSLYHQRGDCAWVKDEEPLDKDCENANMWPSTTRRTKP